MANIPPPVAVHMFILEVHVEMTPSGTCRYIDPHLLTYSLTYSSFTFDFSKEGLFAHEARYITMLAVIFFVNNIGFLGYCI